MTDAAVTPPHLRELFAAEFGEHADALAKQVDAHMETWIVESLERRRRLNPDTWLRDVTLVCLFFQSRQKFPDISISRSCEIIAEAALNNGVSVTAAEMQAMTVDHADLIERLTKVIDKAIPLTGDQT